MEDIREDLGRIKIRNKSEMAIDRQAWIIEFLRRPKLIKSF